MAKFASAIRPCVVIGAVLWVLGCQNGGEHAHQQKTTTSKNSSSVVQLLQTCLDAPELQPYLHPSDTGRIPLMVDTNGFFAEVEGLHKFGEPVVFTSATHEAETPTPAIVFSRFLQQGSSAWVGFSYSVEGVQASLELTQRSGKWEIQNVEIAEY